MPRLPLSLAASALVIASPGVAQPAAAAATGPATEWLFTALLDGKPIGTHRFVLQPVADVSGERRLDSLARFDVKFLGFSAYRYTHRVDERWQGDCLASISAHTDDDGSVTDLLGRATPAGFAVDVRVTGKPAVPSTFVTPGCVMSFAYWNPALARQDRLLDPGSGRIEAVTIGEVDRTAPLDVRGKPVSVRGLRIAGLGHPIDVWYQGDQWVGLDTVVQGGWRLSYRLK
jgi:hypothetical protein